MSDRTYLKCHVYNCPEDQQEAARAALEQWGSWGEYEDDPESPVDGMTTAMDIACDTVPDIAAALRKAAPGASIAGEQPADVRTARSPGDPGRVRHGAESLVQRRARMAASAVPVAGQAVEETGQAAPGAHPAAGALLALVTAVTAGEVARDARAVPAHGRPAWQAADQRTFLPAAGAAPPCP